MPLEKHQLDQFTMEDHMAMVEFCHLLNTAQQAWNRIESGKQCELNVAHYEESSLAHCLRWGMPAGEDLVELTNGAGKTAKTWRVARAGRASFRLGPALEGSLSRESMRHTEHGMCPLCARGGRCT